MHLTRCLAAAAAGWFALGCLGSSPTRAPRLFVLDATAPQASGSMHDLSIGVGPISIPKRLERPQILTRTTDHEVHLAEFDQWAEPLNQSFARAVAENLARSIPTDRVAVYPWSRGADMDWRIEIDVTRFEREADGNVTLAARWRLIRDGERATRQHGAATYREPPGLPTTGALVAAMSRAVGALSSEIAAGISPDGRAGADR
jgi:uncharacterized lipoprotein YmbA